ncbi:hypothetical protein TREMEDRAFT_63303 [Tremella mesenterica DSM 1558]|uniref:uncharacterized protein n=1 Tax=Tremella mesenterica (strain ATCC 24925 / CBS 8224 / DSM 1558 / NBRC 9311 / NRRL Y-6157 / RJB 2259-6 / UBC 559-6) TaxID=578456 RepID=UPI0003F492D7|nr:uncharacterized protein TREMEDRAFT_63303 [Tremella mesenterica DSM 1558]EIW68838.1 hypothetical protein TREMEDRAFT_63303 [Tremella mesenterica DSM 1558]
MSAIRVEPLKKKNTGSVYVTLDDDEIIDYDYSDFEDLGDLSGGTENEVVPEGEVWVEGTSEKPTEGITEGKVLVSQNVKFSGVPKNKPPVEPKVIREMKEKSKRRDKMIHSGGSTQPPSSNPRIPGTWADSNKLTVGRIAGEQPKSRTIRRSRNRGSSNSRENGGRNLGHDDFATNDRYRQPGTRSNFIDSRDSTSKPEVLRSRQDKGKFRESEMRDRGGERRKVDIPIIGGKSDEVKGKIEKKGGFPSRAWVTPGAVRGVEPRILPVTAD